MSAIFRVFETDDNGRPKNYIGVFRAVDRQDARKIASEYFKQPEIVTTGFFNAVEVTIEQINKEYGDDVDAIMRRTRIIN